MIRLSLSILISTLILSRSFAQEIDETNKNIVGFHRIITGSGSWMDIQLAGAGSTFKIHDNTNGSNWVKWTAGGTYTDFLKTVIISNGSLGIGTNDPKEKIHVKGNVYAEGRLYAFRDPGGGGSMLEFRNDRNGSVFSWGFHSNNSGHLYLRNQKNNYNVLSFTANHKVGVGISDPSSKLHIREASAGGSPHAYSKVTLEHNDNAMISILTPNNKTAYFGFADNNDQYVGGMQYSHSSNSMVFRVNNHSNDVIIYNNGNVGIGVNTPSSKLHVDGKIIAEEIKVQNVTGADFVFEEDYDLPTLEETEAFIKSNKHLPGIPSAAEMQEEGLTLGEMNILLLQKIEEMTLQMIEMKKEINELKKNTN